MGLRELLQSKGIPTSGIEVVVQQTNPKLSSSINKSATETVERIVSSYKAPYKGISAAKAKEYTALGEYDNTQPVSDIEITAENPITGYWWQQFQKAPIQSGLDVVGDFWQMAIGTPAEKTDVIQDVFDITAKESGEEKPLSDVLYGEEGERPSWVDQPTLTVPYVEPIALPKIGLPNLGDIGKWALIIAGGLGGIYLLGKYLGRKK